MPPVQPSKPRAKRTTILHISPDMEHGGYGREVVALAIMTQRSGRRAIIASGGGALVQDAERAAVVHKRMPLTSRKPFAPMRNRMTLRSLVGEERPDVIHAHGPDTLPFALSAAKQRNIPLVLDITQPLTDTPSARRMIAAVAKSGAMARVPSEYMGWHLHRDFGLDDRRIRLIPQGVDLKWHSAGFISPERLQGLSQLWRLPEQASVVLMSLPLRPGLGHQVLLEAAAKLKDEPMYIVMVGSDRGHAGFRDEVEQTVARLGLNGKVIMPEYCQDLPAACWLSLVVVAPNANPLGQNFELLAAQSIGRPVIVSDTGANREIVQVGETAWIVPPDDANALADALREVMHLSGERRLDLAGRAHDFIVEKFPQAAWFEDTVELYATLMQSETRKERAA